MSRYVVVDSSVAVKWFKPDGEGGLQAALDLLSHHEREHEIIAVPAHLRLEVLNALWSHGADESTLVAVSAALDQLRLEWFAIDQNGAPQAATISARHGLTLYDAAFVALALELDAELVTADAAIARSGACRVRALRD